MFNKDLTGYKGFSRARNHETQDSTTFQLSTPSAVGCPPRCGADSPLTGPPWFYELYGFELWREPVASGDGFGFNVWDL